jgi:hypothetical protein
MEPAKAYTRKMGSALTVWQRQRVGHRSCNFAGKTSVTISHSDAFLSMDGSHVRLGLLSRNTMKCRHCNTVNPLILPFGRPIEGGRAYAQTCTSCGRVIGLRPRLGTDPTVLPLDLTSQQIERLIFVRWRLSEECAAQIGSRLSDGDGDPSVTAA